MTRSYWWTPLHLNSAILSGCLLAFVLFTAPNSAQAEHFYKPGFTYTLKAADATKSFHDASVVGTFALVQVGNSHISAVNVESANERWRFTSKANAIRHMHNRKTDLLVEAEQLLSLDLATGQIKWQYPLNCYSKDACNTRIRAIHRDVIVLSGFDKQNDNIMLIDAKTGMRLWPNWVAVPEATHMVYTSNTIVVASGKAPYKVFGLDRYTGRKKWGFRPGGTDQPAAGVMAHAGVVTVWWSSKAADSVYSLDLDKGTFLADWMVARRARATGEIRGGGSGYFYSYQPALFGNGGTLKVWDSRTGDTIWRSRYKQVVQAPIHYGNRFFLWERIRSRLTLRVIGAKDGKESWRFDRRNVTDYSYRFNSGRVILRFIGKSPSLFVLNLLNGHVLGAGALPDKQFQSGPFSYVDRWVFMMNGSKLVRMEPEPANVLLIKFDQFVADGQVKEANKLHKLVKPFIDDLPTAAKIHGRVVGQGYRSMAAKMTSGSFAAALPVFLNLAKPKNILYFEDFRTFTVHIKNQLERHNLGQKLGTNGRARLVKLGRRIVELLMRFERKLNATQDKDFAASLRVVFITLAKTMESAHVRGEALKLMDDLWQQSWCDRGPELVNLIKGMVNREVRVLITPLAKAVGRGKNTDKALLGIVNLPGIKLLMPDLVTAKEVPNQTPKRVQAILWRIRQAVK